MAGEIERNAARRKHSFPLKENRLTAIQGTVSLPFKKRSELPPKSLMAAALESVRAMEV